jgi:hypothetical protein
MRTTGTPWYARGEMGEWCLDQLEDLSNDASIENQERIVGKLCERIDYVDAVEEVSNYVEEEEGMALIVPDPYAPRQLSLFPKET